MLTQGYEADGWLGLLLGTSVWYALYGEALTSDSIFEDRMDALCREIGDRGRADADVAADGEATGGPALSLQGELMALKMRELLKRASAAGIVEDAIITAQDSASPKAAIVQLLVEARAAVVVEGELEARAELESLRLSELLARANALGLEEEALDAQDADDPKAAVIELLLRATSG
jgi:hypothetical protein